MIFASAQFEPCDDINQNISVHERYIKKASELKADIIIFPEMSLTGYQKENAAMMSFAPYDTRLNELRELSSSHNIIASVGAPLNISNKLYIGLFIFMPDGSEKIYTKQFLHPGEEDFFEPSFDYNPLLNHSSRNISFAVCADIEEKKHPLNASKLMTDIYCAEIFYTAKSIDHAHEILSYYAKEYSMCVLMSNYCGTSYNMTSGGGSAFWNKKGELISKMNSSDSGILIVEEREGIFSGRTYTVEGYSSVLSAPNR
ncbi:MAG: carbon-nitrogen hydrolase family protein [Spirochaetes bacterium]|nr:carbon-nitrogen hydrolase family protein [Spirochaetota bacterium]